MSIDTMKAQYARYVRNCATSADAAALQSVLLHQLQWLDESIAVNGGCTCHRCAKEAAHKQSQDETPRERMNRLHLVLQRYDETPPSDEPLHEPLEQNALFARDEFSLDEVDLEILLLILRYDRSAYIENVADGVARIIRPAARAVSVLLGAESRAVSARLMPSAPLVGHGIITVQHDPSDVNGLAGQGGWLRLSPPLRQVMHRPFASRQDWADAIIGPAPRSPLEWADFEHLGAERDLAARLLRNAANGHASGINLLLHGPVGTGKTEFCKVLAAAAGCTLWSIGEKDDEGNEPNRQERLAALRLAQLLLKGRPGAVLLFDEAEDLLTRPSYFSGRHRDESKLFVNRLIEENTAPVLWTCNETHGMDPAVLRRMTLALEIKAPNRAARERIWRNVFRGNNLSLPDQTAAQLAGRYEAPPAVAATAARAASLVDGGAAEVEHAARGLLRVLGIGPSSDHRSGGQFDPALVNCESDLAVLAADLARSDAPRNWSMCLHGAPGTGKSEYARYIAAELGLEVMQKRASDLLSKWVGDSEKQIAQAFATARQEGAMLIIDEADSLLFDRRDASRSWEVSQVNEMLTWMDTTRCRSSVRPMRWIASIRHRCGGSRSNFASIR